MDKIKILMVLDNTGRGGAQTYAVNVLRNINREKFQIDFAVNRNPANGYGEEIINYGSKILYIPKFKVYNWGRYYKIWRNHLKKHKYDIIHGHVSSTAYIYLKIAKIHHCATIVHSHSAGYRGSWFTQQVKKIFTKGAKKYADYWFSCSEKASVKLFGNEYKTYPHYSEMPNAINVTTYKFDINIRNKIRKVLGLRNDIFLVGHVGSFSAPKNHLFLLNVFELLKNRINNAKLILVGEGPLEQLIKDCINSKNLTKDVLFTGNVGNVNEYMMAMDVMIFPSKFEGFPITVIEAQATGLYTVLSDTITRQVYLTPILNPASLEDKLSVWVDKALTPQNYDRITINDFIQDSVFNIESSIKKLESLYNKMALS